MSKIGKRPIALGATQVEIKNNEIHYKGRKASGMYALPKGFEVKISGQGLSVMPTQVTGDTNRLWGLHRALLANKIQGADVGFEKQLRISGLGFKAVLSGTALQFTLGYSHKIDFDVPKNITVELDKTGQMMTVKSFDKDLLGQVCSDIRALRPAASDPYKVTGISYVNEVIRRKAGKAKSYILIEFN